MTNDKKRRRPAKMEINPHPGRAIAWGSDEYPLADEHDPAGTVCLRRLYFGLTVFRFDMPAGFIRRCEPGQRQRTMKPLLSRRVSLADEKNPLARDISAQVS
jgi:hypothetical protein